MVTGKTMGRTRTAFTLIELIVVMAIVSLLLALAAPRYFRSVDRAKEAVLREDLSVMRDALDKFYSDAGRYPDAIEELVTKRYLRKVPPDPMTERADTWQISPPPGDAVKGRVYNVRSGAAGVAQDGTLYSEW
jgi:general secretion pathway protein G